MQSNTVHHASSCQTNEGQNSAPQSPPYKSRRLADQANMVAQDVIKDLFKQELISRCDAIISETPVVKPETQMALCEFLIHNPGLNADGLNFFQRHICAWALINHAKTAQPLTVSAKQFDSFMRSDERTSYAMLARKMGLKAAQFAE